MFDSYEIADLCIRLMYFIWPITCFSVLYDLITCVSGTARLPKILRHISETIILSVVVFVWIFSGDQWAQEHKVYQPAVQTTGCVILLAYLYSSYRRRAAALWLEIIVQLFLLLGGAAVIILTLQDDEHHMWVVIGLPAAILFMVAIVTNFRRSDFARPSPTIPTPGTKI
jgi:peptidoglycan/LPS O-acetylase OafA/YrhL